MTTQSSGPGGGGGEASAETVQAPLVSRGPGGTGARSIVSSGAGGAATCSLEVLPL